MAASTADAFGGRAAARAAARQPAPARRHPADGGWRWPWPWRCSASTGAIRRCNQATAHAVHNPAGLLGAYVADLLYQLFGLAAWLPVLVGLSWGLRMALARPLRLAVAADPQPAAGNAGCRRLPRHPAAAADWRAGRCASAWAAPLATCCGAGWSRSLGASLVRAREPGAGAAARLAPRWACAGQRGSGPQAGWRPARSGSGAAWATPPVPPPSARAGWCATVARLELGRLRGRGPPGASGRGRVDPRPQARRGWC